jgi:hypothetical protein
MADKRFKSMPKYRIDIIGCKINVELNTVGKNKWFGSNPYKLNKDILALIKLMNKFTGFYFSSLISQQNVILWWFVSYLWPWEKFF